MKSTAFFAIMLVRLTFIVGLMLGIMVAAGGSSLRMWHFRLGYLMAAGLLVLAGSGLAKRLVPLGLAGLFVALLLPVSGVLQIGYKGLPLGTLQTFHVVLTLAAIGLAEALNGKIQRSV